MAMVENGTRNGRKMVVGYAGGVCSKSSLCCEHGRRYCEEIMPRSVRWVDASAELVGMTEEALSSKLKRRSPSGSQVCPSSSRLLMACRWLSTASFREGEQQGSAPNETGKCQQGVLLSTVSRGCANRSATAFSIA